MQRSIQLGINRAMTTTDVFLSMTPNSLAIRAAVPKNEGGIPAEAIQDAPACAKITQQDAPRMPLIVGGFLYAY
jgi:hypothetical protein